MQEEIDMGDVWLILFAAAAMLTAVPALKRLDAAIDARLKQEDAGEEQAAEADNLPEQEQKEK